MGDYPKKSMKYYRFLLSFTFTNLDECFQRMRIPVGGLTISREDEMLLELWIDLIILRLIDLSLVSA